MQQLPRRITIVGLGYVGLPLALAFSKQFRVEGYDTNRSRVEALRRGVDHNGEVPAAELKPTTAKFTDDPGCLADAEFIIVTVPTPVDEKNEPDLRPLMDASEEIGRQIGRGQPPSPPIVVFESTTYPGCTEEVCGPAIEAASGLRSGAGFKLAYSPERTNFGDPDHNLATVVKVVSAQDDSTAELVETVYGMICKAGTWRTPDIRTAEAAKVIENIQRDLNIALFNELSMVFDRMSISTSDVLDAAATKWNFLRFRPGLVGGHCIPVDPYYLTHKSRQLGHEPEIILAGRKVNESMPAFIAAKALELAFKTGSTPDRPKVLILGMTFKPNISDTRNSKVVDLAERLEASGADITIFDPRVTERSPGPTARFNSTDPFESGPTYDVLILATPHREFMSRTIDELLQVLKPGGAVVDVTGALQKPQIEGRGYRYWRP